MNQAIYRKYRPRGWDEVIGQDHVVRTLRNAVARSRVGHAYLFAGPRGTGKTTLARILAKALNCLSEDPAGRPCNACENCRAANENRFLDLVEMDAASNTGVDDVRSLRDKIGFAPSQGTYRIYIVDEAHMLSTSAFNALLKTLEEPPPHAVFVLATTEIHKIPATVLSRCQRHEFRRVPVAEIVSSLRHIVQQEGWHADEDALLFIARQATGSIRDAQSLLDQLAASSGRIALDVVQPVFGTAASTAVVEMVEAIRDQLAPAALQTLRAALDSGVDPRTLARQTVDYLRGLLLVQMGNTDQVEAGSEQRRTMQAHAAAFSSPQLIRLIRSFNSAASDARGGWQPSLALELAVAEALDSSPNAAGEATSGKPGAAGLGAGGMRPARPAAQPGRISESRTESAATATSTSYETGNSTGATPSQESVDASSPARSSDTPPALTDVIAAWKSIRGALKQTHPAADGLLNSSKPIEIRGDELIIGFQTDAVRAIMDRPENLQATRDAIADVLGQSLRIRCIVVNAVGKAPPNMAQDGMVATALDQGGEIVDIHD